MSSPERPPPIPTKISEYDGHENYRERFKRTSFFAAFAHSLPIYLGILIAAGFGYSVARVVLLTGDSGTLTGVAAALVFLIVGVIGFFGYVIVLGFMRTAEALRGWLAVGALFFMLMAFYPFAADYRPPLAPPSDAAATVELLATLRATGRVGAPGEVPPMLSVSAGEGWFDVTNKTASHLLVEMAQVEQSASAAGGWNRCELYTRRGGSAGAYKYRLGPFLTMRMYGSQYCAERFGYSQLEFRVGDATTPATETWWSDSTGP